MKTKLEELRKEIIKSNPDIVELKLFECEVYCEQCWEDSNGNYHDEYGIIIKNDLNVDKETGLEIQIAGGGRILYGEPTEIIGRDINLEDILKCYKEVFRKNYGGIFRTEANLLEVLSIWELGKPLHEQSEATINALHNLICNRK